MIRSATSVAAHYRAAGRARSRADFANILGIVEEEADETLFWIEMLMEAKTLTESDVQILLKEAKELSPSSLLRTTQQESMQQVISTFDTMRMIKVIKLKT